MCTHRRARPSILLAERTVEEHRTVVVGPNEVDASLRERHNVQDNNFLSKQHGEEMTSCAQEISHYSRTTLFFRYKILRSVRTIVCPNTLFVEGQFLERVVRASGGILQQKTGGISL